MIIDFGVSVFSCAERGVTERDAIAPLVRNMDLCGADKAVILNGTGDEDYLEEILRQAKSLDSDRVISLCPIQPDSDYALEYVWKASDEELRGICLLPRGEFCASDERYFRVYDLARALGLVTVFAPLCGLPGAELIYAEPRDIAKIAVNFPGIKIAAECRGGLAEVRNLLGSVRSADVCALTSCRRGLVPDAAALSELVRDFGAERLIFGSGEPRRSLAEEMAFIRLLGISESDKKMILGGNAARFLDL